MGSHFGSFLFILLNHYRRESFSSEGADAGRGRVRMLIKVIRFSVE